MYSSKHNQLLARVNFPLYTVQALTERHILIAGGGGSTRSGILNVIEIYELFNNGSTCRAERVNHYETGNMAIMNCTIFDAGRYYLLFAGMEGVCRVFKISYEVGNTEVVNTDSPSFPEGSKSKDFKSFSEFDKNSSEDVSLRKRNKEKNLTVDGKMRSNSYEKLIFNIHPLEAFQTDFSPEEPFQKLVKFSKSRQFLVTGGCDGHIRFWKPPNMTKFLDIEAHSDDVDDLDISPCGKIVVTVSRDGFGKVWNSDKGTLINDLQHHCNNSAVDSKYIFRSCRFGIIDGGDRDGDFALFCTLNPAKRRKPPLESYLCKFNTKKFSHEKTISTGSEMLSAIAVSDDGHFIGLGTQSGGIKMFIAFSLQLIYNVDNCHGIFVTSLCFLPTSEKSRRIAGGHEASLLSVSVDNHVVIHNIPERKSMSILTLITLCILTLFLVFLLMDFLNL